MTIWTVGIGLKIEVERQDLAGDLLGCVILTADQESVDRELDIVCRIRNAGAAVFEASTAALLRALRTKGVLL
jgi:hypothetical protein